jgi:hypothetical protein
MPCVNEIKTGSALQIEQPRAGFYTICTTPDDSYFVTPER